MAARRPLELDKMSYKLASYVSLLFFFAIGLAFFLAASAMPDGDGYDVGPAFFPRIMSILMMATAVIGMVTTWRKSQDSHVEISKPFQLLATIGVAVAFVALWTLTGQFLPLSFLAVAVLLHLLNPQPMSRGKLIKTLTISAIVVAVFYVVFDLLLGLRL